MACPRAASNGTSSADRPATPLRWGGHGENQASLTALPEVAELQFDAEVAGLQQVNRGLQFILRR